MSLSCTSLATTELFLVFAICTSQLNAFCVIFVVRMLLQDYQGLCDIILKPKARSNADAVLQKVCFVATLSFTFDNATNPGECFHIHIDSSRNACTCIMMFNIFLVILILQVFAFVVL